MFPQLIVLFALSCLGSYAFKRYAIHKNTLDEPNHRSLHSIPTPRGGGIIFMGIWFCFTVGFIHHYSDFLREGLALLLPTLVIALVSFIDDHITLASKWRLLVHILAALYFLLFLFQTQSPMPLELGFFTVTSFSLSLIFIFLLLVWSTNLFNFMDGCDGFATLEASFVLGGGAFLLTHFHGQNFSELCLALIAVLLGFLVWNWPRAKLFMGDVGSASLGFVIAAIAILAQKFYGVPLYLWLMLYGVFLFDASITLVRRLFKGERWYEAHRSHAFQRLALSGWSHLKILLACCVCNIGIFCLVLASLYFNTWRSIFILIEFFMLSMLYYRVEKIYPMFRVAVKK